MRAPWDEAKGLERPLPDDALTIRNAWRGEGGSDRRVAAPENKRDAAVPQITDRQFWQIMICLLEGHFLRGGLRWDSRRFYLLASLSCSCFLSLLILIPQLQRQPTRKNAHWERRASSTLALG